MGGSGFGKGYGYLDKPVQVPGYLNDQTRPSREAWIEAKHREEIPDALNSLIYITSSK